MKCFDFSVKNPKLRRLNKVLAGLFVLVILVLSDAVMAIEVTDLYQGIVPVESRDNVRERQQAFNEALRQVLLKITGNSTIYNQPLIRRALTNADDYVETWSYRTVTSSRGEDDISGEAPGIELTVTFFEPEVLALLDSAGIPLWPRNRPYTLVWLVIQDELGGRQLVGSSSRDNLDILSMLEIGAQRRGLPVLLPILDFEDLRAVSTNDVWNMDTERLLAASARYQSESVLVIRLFRTLAGDVFGRSNYLFRNQVFELELFEESVETFVEQSIALAVDELSAYYAVLLSGTDSSMEVNLTVNGITSAENYASLLGYIAQLTDVNEHHIVRVKDQTIQLKLVTGGQLRQLVETIALNRNMQPDGDLVRMDNQVFMSYWWNR
jgi:hypothetical protein